MKSHGFIYTVVESYLIFYYRFTRFSVINFWENIFNKPSTTQRDGFGVFDLAEIITGGSKNTKNMGILCEIFR
jgi:hypothetical protein